MYCTVDHGNYRKGKTVNKYNKRPHHMYYYNYTSFWLCENQYQAVISPTCNKEDSQVSNRN